MGHCAPVQDVGPPFGDSSHKMKRTNAQRSVRLPSKPGSKFATISVDLPADVAACLDGKTPEECGQILEEAFLKAVAAHKWNHASLAPFTLPGDVLVVPVPLPKRLAAAFTDIADRRGLNLGALVGSQAQTWHDSVDRSDKGEEVETALAALRYNLTTFKQVHGSKVP